MQKAYNRINWENYPSDKTPVNKHNLNKIDAALDEVDNRILVVDTTKFEKSDAQTLIKSITFNRSNGVFTITYFNNTTATIDTMLEKLMVNFAYDYQEQRLVITLDDGTKQYVDLSALITQYEFLDSDTIAFTLSSDGKVSAKVKEGSIQEKHLQPNYLADIKVEVAKAQSSASGAAASEISAQSAADSASQSAQAASDSAEAAEASRTAADTSATNASISAQSAAGSADAAQSSKEAAAQSAQAAAGSAGQAAASAVAAAVSAESAENQALTAKSYAVGTNGTVREGDAADNSKYYSEQSQISATASKSWYDLVESTGSETIEAINNAIDNINQGLPQFVLNFEDGKLYYSGTKFTFVVNPATGNLDWGLTV